MNFFEIVNAHLSSLTKSEQSLFDYVIKNMDHIKTQSIREVAAETFVSTATFFCVLSKKIGFSGFSEFTTVIKFTVLNNKDEEKPSPFTVSQTDYREEYLKKTLQSPFGSFRRKSFTKSHPN